VNPDHKTLQILMRRSVMFTYFNLGHLAIVNDGASLENAKKKLSGIFTAV